MIGNGALALFKLKPAVVSLEGDKAVLKFADGSTLKVRPKDAEPLHPGPVDRVPEPRADGDFGTHHIVDGLIVIPKNAVIPSGSVI